MTLDSRIQAVIWEETVCDQPLSLTVTIPHDAALELAELLGNVALLCADQPALIDAAIAAHGGCGGLDAADIACKAATRAWALEVTASGLAWEPGR